jgi:NitT/TauT family transport system substrate-binding protein
METINWINTNPNKIEMIFDEFLYDFMGHSLDEEIINVSLSNILISTDPMNSSIYTFAEHAYELGYLGRQKYDLTGIFYLALDTARMMN